MQKAVFKEAYQKRRGLVIMSGFFEWQKTSEAKKPWYITRDDGELLTVASIWESRTDDYGNRMITSALLTTEANSLMRPIHDRMPVLIEEKDRDAWLDTSSFHQETLSALASPKSIPHLTCYPVTPKMNNARFDKRSAIEPLKF
jgi:putative SOS response-associated peptidase YedK